MNSTNFFLAELERMNSCIYRIKPQTLGWDCSGCGIICFLYCSKKLLFTSERTCKIHYLTRVCNQYPMLTLHIAGLPIYNGKSLNGKNWKLVTGKWMKVPILEWRYTIEYLLGRNIDFRYSFLQHKICQLAPKTFVPPTQ